MTSETTKVLQDDTPVDTHSISNIKIRMSLLIQVDDVSVGLPEIHLTVYPDNAPAIRAYEKVGFEPYILEMRLNLDEQS